MNILHTSFECYPIAKVGGLADVVGALPKYQNQLDHEVNVIIPFYNNQFTKDSKRESLYKGIVRLGEFSYPYTIKRIISPDLGFKVFQIYIEGILDTSDVYNYENDTERYIAFQLAILDWINSEDSVLPDVIHCHDHHTGLIPFLIAHVDSYKTLREIPTVFTIHNAQYQGQISYDKLHYFPDFDTKKIGLLDWDHHINPMAAAIKCSWQVTTVSPNYMNELQEKANGLEGLLRHEKTKCAGILNGIDSQNWNPETDPMIKKNYKITNVVSGRKTNKKWLCDHFNLKAEKPLFAFIGRLVSEKGADLLPEIIEESLSNTDINILILGSGNSETEEQLELLKEKFTGRYNVFIGYDEKLSHIIYAGTDFLLMPSRVEPCGLNQMYALRYGSIPVVTRTGGLKDTVMDIGDNGFGICHDNASVGDVYYSIKRAIALYNDQKKFREIQKRIMKIDHSWNQSANQYIKIYESLIQ